MRLVISFVLMALAAHAQFSDPRWRVRKVGAASDRPATCVANRDVFVCSGSGCSPNPSLEFCTAANTFTAFSGSGAVSSVFGRTGAVTATSGDYTAAQVTNAADKTAANTFTAGAKQTLQASATTAGLLVSCAALPSSPATGDVACDSGDSNKLKWYNGTSWQTAGGGGGSGTVTNTGTLTANLPIIGNGGVDVTTGTRQGNTTAFVTYSGSAPSTNDCAKFDASGNLTTAGAACGSSTGLGDPGSNGVVYRNGSGTSTTASATEIGAPLYCADAGSNDTYACSLSPAPAAYATGAVYQFKAATANTGAATINFNSLGAKTIKKAAGGVTTDLSDNDIRAGQVVTLTYDGTNMQMQSILGNAASGGSGNSTTTGSYASSPGTCTDGDVRFPSDSVYLLRCASNAWVPWGPVYPMTDPANAGLSTWRNQGSSTVDTTYGGIYLTAPTGTGENVRIREKTLPSPPYKITVAFAPHTLMVNYSQCGVVLIENSSGKLNTFGVGYNSALYSNVNATTITNWTSVTAASADVFTGVYGATLQAGRLIILQVEDDNTNRMYRHCSDTAGKFCKQVYSVARTTFLTPDRIGIFCNTNNATYSASMWLQSWKQE